MRGVLCGTLLAAAGAAVLCLSVATGPAAKAEAQQAEARGAAQAVSQRAVNRLRRASCPAAYQNRVRRSNHSNRDLRMARRWRFKLGGSYRRLKPPINWRQNPVGSLSYQARLHDLRWLDVLVHAFRQSGNRARLRQARRIVVDWVRQNHRRNRPTTPRTWFDKVAADRAPMLGYVIRAASCRRILNRRQARVLLGSAAQHGQFLSRGSTHTWTNRGLFVDMGRLLLGRTIRFLPDAGRWRRGGEQRFRQTAQRLTYPDEAFWLEHSTTYQFLTINAIGRFLEIPQVKPRGLRQLHQRMQRTAGLLVMPDRRWLQAGNSYREQGRAWANKARREQIGGLITKPRSGLAFVNHRQTYLALLAGFHSSTHKHSDDLSFDLFDQGRRIVADTGMFHKDPNEFVAFQESARAHSVLTVDGADFPRDDAAAYGSGLRASGQLGERWFGIDATNPLLRRQGVDHRRLLLYNRGYGLIVADSVRSDRRHTYRRYFQLGSPVRATQEQDGVALQDMPGFRGHLYSRSSAPAERTILTRGERDPLSGFLFPGFRQREQRWTVELRTEGADVDHVTTIALDRGRLLRAEPIGEIGPTTQLALHRNGELHQILTVRRHGDQLTISQHAPEEIAGP